jgi:hypothetical protein
MSESVAQVRYQEAFPKFNMFEARCALKYSNKICEFVDHVGRKMGHARITGVDDTHLTLEYKFGSPFVPYTYNTIDIPLVAKELWSNNYPNNILCPACNEIKSVLIYQETWKCRSCHKLLYRTQHLDRVTILWERMKRLESVVGYARPKGMHAKTYRPLRKKYNDLRRSLTGVAVPEASNAHSYFLVATWRDAVAEDSFEFMGPKDGETY